MSGLAARAVRAISRTLPLRVRERYREEWSADVAGAAEAGIHPLAVVVGAVTTAITIDRMDPVVTGVALGRTYLHRLGVASGFALAAAILAVGYQLYGGYRMPAERGSAGGEAVAAAGLVVPVLAAALGVLALVNVVVAVRAAAAGRRPVAAVLTVLGFAALVAALLSRAGAILAFLGAAPALIGLVTIAWMLTGPGSGARAPARWLRVALAVAVPLSALGVGAFAIAHVYVWNPLAAVPGLPLDEIYARLEAAGEALGSGAWAVVWIGATVVGALGYLALAALPVRRLRAAMTGRRLVALGLLLVAGTILLGYLPSFSMGMGIADAFMTSGGDAAPSGPVLALLGQFALAGTALVTLVRRPPLPAPDPRQRIAAA